MTDAAHAQKDVSNNVLLVCAAWAAVGLPLLWGVIRTLYNAVLLFR
jgi:hypothetical protein